MIGLDIIAIERFSRLQSEEHRHWQKVFIKEEWDYAFSQPGPAATLAGIFAAKEAVMKAWGGDLLGRPDRIIIRHLPDGKPQAIIEKADSGLVDISVSHEAGLAVAVAFVYER